MTIVTVKISTRSKKAKQLLDQIEELAKTEKGIIICETKVPNAVTLKAMDDAEKRKVIRVKSVDDLFNSI